MLEKICQKTIALATQKQKHCIITGYFMHHRCTVSTIASVRELNVRTLCDEGRLKEALETLHLMNQPGTYADSHTYCDLLQGCINLTSLGMGLRVHAHMIEVGFEADMFLTTKLLIMYSKFGCLIDSRQLFDKIPEPNSFSFNAMIAGYAQYNDGESALTLFYQMQRAGVKIDQYTLSSILRVCAGLVALEHGKQVHARIVKSGFVLEIVLETALVDMYAKCGSIEDASLVFDEMSLRDVVSWNAMIAGCTHHGHMEKALRLFCKMQQAGVKVNPFTYASMLTACACLAVLEQGKQVHAHIIIRGFEPQGVLGTALVDMYAKCGCLTKAFKIFHEMSQRDLVLFNAMIAGCAQQGYGEEALILFHQMQRKRMRPNQITFASALSACSSIAALQQGKQVHAHIIKNGFELDVVLGNAFVDMYAKCGMIESAHQVFNKMFKKNVVSWTAMIAGYGNHGNGNEAVCLFEEMQRVGTKPNHITFLAVLSACSHAGLVDKGWQIFDSMRRDHHITPSSKHYACFVDLLGRAGHLDEAQEFIHEIQIEPDASILGALLGACRISSDMELGKRTAERLIELTPENPGNYVFLSNIYAADGRWEDVEKVRKMMKDKGVKKEPGCSWIEVQNRMHKFFVGDKSHPQTEEIYETLDRLSGQMKKLGYVPHTHLVLHDVEEEQKEHILGHHSEKLAIAFGIISLFPGTRIQIFKNLRVCSDCHTATKFISKIVGREIVVRDANRFHYFKSGLCSCGDYW
eukprot:Gb_28343 [translate_table: standard]